MPLVWFRPLGWIYRPVSVVGWIITVLTIAACVWVLVVADRNSHSVSDTLISAFPYAAIFMMIAGWIASHTAGKG